MSDLISREEVLNLIDTAFESGAFDGRYAYENLIDAVQNLIHPLETDLISRQAVLDEINRIGNGAFTEYAYYSNLFDFVGDLPSVEPEKCRDCISRQAVIDTIETDCSWDIFNEWGSRTPTGECIINAIKSVPPVEPEKCGDCISRQAVLDLAKSGKLVSNRNYKSVCDAINGLPSFPLARHTGEWKEAYAETDYRNGYIEFTCENCKYQHGLESGEYNWHFGDPIPWKYCPMCGARMEADNGTR